MASINQATVVGFLGEEPKVSTTQAGRKVASFSVATTENETTFIRIYPLLSDIELADYYRVEVDSIQKRAKELGLKKDPSLTKYEANEEEEANKKIMGQPPTNKSGARKKLNTVWEIAQRNTLDKLNNKRKELESKILKSEKFDERTYEEWKVLNLKCQGLECILK